MTTSCPEIRRRPDLRDLHSLFEPDRETDARGQAGDGSRHCPLSLGSPWSRARGLLFAFFVGDEVQSQTLNEYAAHVREIVMHSAPTGLTRHQPSRGKLQ